MARSHKRLIPLAGLITMLILPVLSSGKLSSTSAFADSSRIVSVFADGQKKVISFSGGNVASALRDAGVALGPHDLVEPATSTPIPAGFFNINVYRSRKVLVVDGTKTYLTDTAYQNPGLIASSAGLTVYPEDRYDISTITNFVKDGIVGEKVTIKRATPVTVYADGVIKVVRTQSHTVKDALAEGGIALGPKDEVMPALSAQLAPGMKVVITRVAEADLTVKETIPAPVQTIKDPSQPKGYSAVQQPGSDGSRVVTYLVHYRNGIEVGRDTLSVTDQIAPKPKVVVIGTKIFFPGSVEYWRPYVEQAAAANGVDPNLLLAIMKCESNGNATDYNGYGPGHYGLYQYDPTTWESAGGTMSNIYDGATQINITAWKVANYGTGPWNASQWCWSKLIN